LPWRRRRIPEEVSPAGGRCLFIRLNANPDAPGSHILAYWVIPGTVIAGRSGRLFFLRTEIERYLGLFAHRGVKRLKNQAYT
jgi:hypothetical protein